MNALLRLHLALAVALIASNGWTAAPGDLDTTFGSGGIIIMHPGYDSGTELAHSVAVQPDGKIVLGGYQNSSYGLVRFHSNGTLDTSFGAGGIVIPPFGFSGFGDLRMALQSDGKIALAGANFSATRNLTNGQVDLSFGFGGTGKATTQMGPSSGAQDMVLQPDNKMIIGGYAGLDIALIRYDTNGILDDSFGSVGRVITDLGDIDRCTGLALQSDGKIIAAGFSYASSSPSNRWVLVRYTARGLVDTNFGANGKAFGLSGSMSRLEIPYAVTVQRDGRILLGGDVSNRIALQRFNPNGSVDTNFGVGGKVLTQASPFVSGCRAIVQQRNGKIIAAGYAPPQSRSSAFVTVRYNEDGTLDTTFDGDGIVTNTTGLAYDVVLQPDGRILVAGLIENATPYSDFGLLRLEGDAVNVVPPAITSQPLGQRVPIGTTVTFTVIATGAPPVFYYWRFNGGHIPEATNAMLVLTNVSASSSGTYSVVVSNEFGATISSNAVLNVNRPPVADARATAPVVISPNNSNGLVLLNGTLSSDVDADALTYLWFLEGGGDAIASGVMAVTTQPLGMRSFALQVSDGLASDTNHITVEMITAAEAVRRLLVEVEESNLKRIGKHLLIVRLRRAERFFKHGNSQAGIIRLEKFQRKVQHFVGSLDPELANRWIGQAQFIINAVQSNEPAR